jgi:hypothetical protein
MADDKESAHGNGTKPKKAPTFAKVPISLVSDQTFDDNESRKDSHLAKIFHGTLAEHTEALAQKNHRGAGIFVLVREGDGQWGVRTRI